MIGGFKMKKILAIILVVCTLCLSSCGIFKELKAGMDEAFVLVENFCTALSNDDFDTAKGYLHPNSTPNQNVLFAFISRLEKTHSIDFSDGVAFKHRRGIRSAYYDSSYDGSVHEIDYEIVVGGVPVYSFFIVVKNDNGYGLYNFGIEK